MQRQQFNTAETVELQKNVLKKHSGALKHLIYHKKKKLEAH